MLKDRRSLFRYHTSVVEEAKTKRKSGIDFEMILLHTFFHWFSLRIGSIIIGVITLIQCSIWLMLSIICQVNESSVTEAMKKLIEDLSIKNKIMNQLADDPKVYLIILASFSSIFLLSCILEIYGSYECNHYLIYPFVVLDFIYIIFLTMQHVFLMLYLKEENIGIGRLILFSNFGGFLILLFLYMWYCVVSYTIIIKLLLKRIANKNDKRERRRQLRQNLIRTGNNQITINLFGIGNEEEEESTNTTTNMIL